MTCDMSTPAARGMESLRSFCLAMLNSDTGIGSQSVIFTVTACHHKFVRPYVSANARNFSYTSVTWNT